MLEVEIEAIWECSDRTYGVPRVTAWLRKQGFAVSGKRVARLMHRNGWESESGRSKVRTTILDRGAKAASDHVRRDFNPTAPNQTWCGDITYLRTGEGWLYLATVIDLATGKVIGWQTAEHMRASLVVDALEMARTQGGAASGAIFHSDHGSQYTSDECVTYCANNGFTQSMGRTGVCWDNAAAETFFATLKNEMYHQQVFATRARARFAVAEYIEVFYNRRRPHSSIGYRTPARAWNDHHAAQDLSRAA